MKKIDANELLRLHGIRPTANRILIIEMLAKQSSPISIKELEAKVQTIDRSNIFRTLSLFRQYHLVHQIDNGIDGLLYELCTSVSHEVYDDRHVHFYCETCQQTTCLNEIPVPTIALPNEYVSLAANYVIKGYCPMCSAKQKYDPRRK